MAREREGYRDNLAILNERFPDRDLLTIEQVMQVTGYRSRATVRKYFGTKMVNGLLSKAALARYMCG